MAPRRILGIAIIVSSLAIYGWLNRDYFREELELRMDDSARTVRTADSPEVYAPWPFEDYDQPFNDIVLSLPQAQKERLAATARGALEGAPEPASWEAAFDGMSHSVRVALWQRGAVGGIGVASEANLEAAVYRAAQEAAASVPDAGDADVHIYIAGPAAPLSDRSRGYLETGLAGLDVIVDGEVRAARLPADIVERNEKLLPWLQDACAEAGLGEFCETDGALERSVYPAVHFGTTPFSEHVVTFYRGHVPDLQPELSREKVEASIDLGMEWLVDNLNPDGFFNYGYEPSTDTYSGANNMIRQLMPSRLLAEMAQTNENYREAHRRNLDHVFTAWYRENGNEGYIFYRQGSKLGANGIALRTLVWSPFFEEYADKAEALATGIVSLMGEDGSLKPWYIQIPTSTTSEKRLLYFYSGEALLGLVEYYEKTGDERWLDAARKGQDYYLGEYLDRMGENYYPAYVPWHTMSLFKLYTITNDPRYADAIFVMNDKLLELQNDSGQPLPDLLGRFYNPRYPQYGTPHASSTGVYMDGLTYAYELAVDLGDDVHAERYRRAIVLATHNLINLQFKGSDMYYVAHPERVKGAFRTDATDNRIRSDNAQHALDGMIRAVVLFADADWRLDETF